MPWGDRTGPRGEGPLTGRQMGYCAGFLVPGFLKDRIFGTRTQGPNFWQTASWLLIPISVATIGFWIYRMARNADAQN